MKMLVLKECSALVFSSLTFLCFFLPVTVGLYFAMPGIRTKNAVLLVASLVFYAWGEPVWVLALIALTVLVWVCSGVIAKSEKTWLRRIALTLAVLGPMGVLMYVKYAGFLLAPVLKLAGLSIPTVRMPLGISFFTFQIVTYAVDVYRRRELYQPRLLDLMLYIGCFPQLVAGPIVCYQDVHEQLRERTTGMEDFTEGMKRFAVGLGKKVILANVCGMIVEDVVANQALYGMSVAGTWYMAALYSLQIYFDFSGYSDMAIGMGRIFGFKYLENFNYPYISRGVSEFWRRWHMSLGKFFREYMYIPLGGNRCGAVRQIFNLLLVWTFTGLWHGADINFVLWGLYYFVLLVLEKFVFKKVQQKLPGLLNGLITYALVLVGWVIFYFTDLTQLHNYLGAMFGFGGVRLMTDELWIVINQYSWFPLVAMAAALPLWRAIRTEVLERLRPAYTVWLTLVFVLSVLLIVGQSYNPFIYFRF